MYIPERKFSHFRRANDQRTHIQNKFPLFLGHLFFRQLIYIWILVVRMCTVLDHSLLKLFHLKGIER